MRALTLSVLLCFACSAWAIGAPDLVDRDGDAAWQEAYAAKGPTDLREHASAVLATFVSKASEIPVADYDADVLRMLRPNVSIAAEKAVRASLESGTSATETTDAPTANPSREMARVVVLRLEGEVGEDFLAEGLGEALTKLAGAGDLVLIELAGRGGSGADAMTMRNAVLRARERIPVWCSIEDEAYGALLGVVMAADRCFVSPGASVGAMGQGAAPGEVIHGSFNAAWVARVTSASPAFAGMEPLVEAMFLRDQTAAAWAEDGEVRVGAEAPEAMGNAVLVSDDESSLLTLTGEAMTRLGTASPAAELDNALAEKLQAERLIRRDFTDQVQVHARRMAINSKQVATDRAERRQRMSELHKLLPRIMPALRELQRHAESVDPRRQTYTVWEDTGRFTGASYQKWRDHTDQAIAAWQRVQAGCKTGAERVKEAEALGMNEAASYKSQLMAMSDVASRTIDRLREERRNSRP
ncbi:MAG: hypothetical protein AAFY08_04360 [Planctomycetota bacterium]